MSGGLIMGLQLSEILQILVRSKSLVTAERPHELDQRFQGGGSL